MESRTEQNGLSTSDSPALHLDHPTQDECNYKTTYILESQFLTNIPLAKDGGMTTWILVDKNMSPDQRRIFCSCETFYKRSLTSDILGNVEEVLVHGIASVFCPQEYRRRGYAARHMKELSKQLRNWQSSGARVAGSVLYSDIGKSYYAKLGWIPNSTNMHIEFSPSKVPRPASVRDITENDLPGLCKRDEDMIREAMSTPATVKTRLTILPDLDHMLWHIRKEDFATNHLFGRVAHAKGAIVGPAGKQVWAIWTHRYYGRHDTESPNNVLCILRLVVEGDKSANMAPMDGMSGTETTLPDKQAAYLTLILQAAQAEAAEWQLDHVKLWDPSPCVEKTIAKSRIDHVVVEREEESIASGMWYDEHDNLEPPPTWINNQHYAWC
ncbi:hypothetical protein F4781DRAFT_423739 [Annulohypoxylon bovei var. microspora]|nr:hypothetical protein F4781DRAFT_423739 [Annulohypoxylon bovei var. microspora]